MIRSIQKLLNFVDLSPTIRELIDKCQKTKEHAYCPYSNFRVGSAVLTDNGQIFTGSNVENASYGLTICGERVAVSKAVSEGHRKFKAIAVCTDLDEFKAPCGACRQFLIEVGRWRFTDLFTILLLSL